MTNNSLRDVIIVMGQSGLKVDDCIRRIIGNESGLSHFSFKPHLEFALEEEGKSRAKSLHQEKREIEPPRFSLVDYLSSPPRTMQGIWRSAFSHLSDELQRTHPVPKEGQKIIVSLHGCHYNQTTREYLFPTDLEMLSSLKARTKAVVTLIDDCFDIYVRLAQEGQMYHKYIHKEGVTQLDAAAKAMASLNEIVSWREHEIAFSRLIANWFRAEFYVLAVKHPIEIGRRLFKMDSSQLQIRYMAHPISTVRKADGEDELKYKADLILAYEQEVENNPRLVLFLPDTIDEFRFRPDADSMPSLVQRWPLPGDKYSRIAPPFEDNIDSKALYPLGEPELHALETKERSSIISRAKAKAEAFQERIRQQVGSRDHCLVEQSRDGLLVHRPRLFGNAITQGVHKEIIYNEKLRSIHEGERKLDVREKRRDFAEFMVKKFLSTAGERFTLVGLKDKHVFLEPFIKEELAGCHSYGDGSNHDSWLAGFIGRATAYFDKGTKNLGWPEKTPSALDGGELATTDDFFSHLKEEIVDSYREDIADTKAFFRCLVRDRGGSRTWIG